LKVSVSEETTLNLINSLNVIKSLTGDNIIMSKNISDVIKSSSLYDGASTFEETFDSIFDSLEDFALNENNISNTTILYKIIKSIMYIYQYIDAEEKNNFNDKISNYLKSKILNRLELRYLNIYDSFKNSYMSNTNKCKFNNDVNSVTVADDTNNNEKQ